MGSTIIKRAATLSLLIATLCWLGCPVNSKNCPLGMDPLCVSCNASNECTQCKPGYFPNPNASAQQCFACSDGCVLCSTTPLKLIRVSRCSTSATCDKCQSEGYYMEQGYCWPCNNACIKCVDDKGCQECEEQYFAVKGDCSLLKVQVYIAIACLGALLVLIVACCYMLIREKEKPNPNETFYSHFQNKTLLGKTISFNVLDEEARRDTSKISDLETIGKVHRGASVLKLSLIENQNSQNIMEDEAVSNKKNIDFTRSFLTS